MISIRRRLKNRYNGFKDKILKFNYHRLDLFKGRIQFNCMILPKIKIFTISIAASFLLALGCVTDPGVSKKRGMVVDFSIANSSAGCNNDYLVLSNTISPNQKATPEITCAASCGTNTGVHLADATELTNLKLKVDSTILNRIDASSGVCVDDVVNLARPTNQIDIKSDFCSCIGGKSDLINDCASFCANAAVSISPILYLNTIIGPDIALNEKIGNLANWCNVQLASDLTTPQCFLNASDGINTISNIPILSINGNSLTANIQSLALNRTYIMKIIEGKSGSNAQSKEFQLRRKVQPAEDASLLGALKITPISQYTCMTYGGFLDTVTGQITRTSYARVFYYFASNEMPPPIPPMGGNNQSIVVCHDEELHPGSDSAAYPRLELIPQLFVMWDKADPRFVNENNTGLTINKTLTNRLINEFNVQPTSPIDIFKLINYPNRPSTSSTASPAISLGYIMVPFIDKTGKSFCPTQVDYNSANQPLFNLLKEYMDDTEGLYLGEKEAEAVQDVNNNTYKIIYGTMFITETVVKKYGFYFENGLKIKADLSSMNTKTINYYWPTNDTMDPLAQGNRKLFTVRSYNNLSGNVPSGQPVNQSTSDKRIGCVPKSSL